VHDHLAVVQELLAEEMAAAVGMSMEALGKALRMALSNIGAVSTLRSIEALVPARSCTLFSA
jgi:hypothetical protein